MSDVSSRGAFCGAKYAGTTRARKVSPLTLQLPATAVIPVSALSFRGPDFCLIRYQPNCRYRKRALLRVLLNRINRPKKKKKFSTHLKRTPTNELYMYKGRIASWTQRIKQLRVSIGWDVKEGISRPLLIPDRTFSCQGFADSELILRAAFLAFW